MKPTNMGTGRVTGQFAMGVADGPDLDDEPEIIPLAGTVTFTPSVPYLPNRTAEPNPITIVTAPIKAVLDEEGYLCTPDTDGVTPQYRGIRLFATDDEDTSVKNWTYSVTYRFSVVNGATPALKAHSISLPEGSEVDLTKAVEVPSSPGIGTPQALALLAEAEAAAASSAESATVALQVKADADAGLFKGETGPAGPNAIPTDEFNAGLIQDPASATAGALSAAYGLIGGASFTILGDSITRQCDGAQYNAPRSTGYWGWGTYYLDQRATLLRNAGVSGNTTAQMIARFAADVTPYASDWVFVLAGANDITQDVPAETTIANLTTIYNTITSLGRKIASATIMPSASMNTGGRKAALAAVNKWIRNTAQAADRPCADFYTAYVDASTGGPAATLSADGTHPSTAGAIRLGAALADALHPHLVTVPLIGTSNADAGNLLTNGAMTGNAAGIATGWTAANASGTPSVLKFKMHRPELPGFEWQTFEFGPASAGDLSFYATSPAASLEPGDTVELLAEIETENITGAGFINATVRTRQAGGAQNSQGDAAYPSGSASAIYPGRGILRTSAVIGGTLADHAMAQILIQGVTSGIVRVGRVIIRKV